MMKKSLRSKYKKLCKELIEKRYEQDIENFNNFSEGSLKISLNNPLERESWKSKYDYDEFILHYSPEIWYDFSNNKKILSINKKDDNTNYFFKEFYSYSSSKSKKVRKFCLNLSLRLPVLRSIIKKLGGVCVHKL